MVIGERGMNPVTMTFSNPQGEVRQAKYQTSDLLFSSPVQLSYKASTNVADVIEFVCGSWIMVKQNLNKSPACGCQHSAVGCLIQDKKLSSKRGIIV